MLIESDPLDTNNIRSALEKIGVKSPCAHSDLRSGGGRSAQQAGVSLNSASKQGDRQPYRRSDRHGSFPRIPAAAVHRHSEGLEDYARAARFWDYS